MKGQCVESRRAGFDCWNTTLVRQQLFKLPPFFLIVLIGKRLPKWQTRQLPPLWTRALTPIYLPAIWHGLEKVDHVPQAGSASVCLSPGCAPLALDNQLSQQSKAISPLAPPPSPLAAHLAERLRHWTARSSLQSTAISLGSLGGGRRREATLRRHRFGFCSYLCFSGLALFLTLSS